MHDPLHLLPLLLAQTINFCIKRGALVYVCPLDRFTSCLSCYHPYISYHTASQQADMLRKSGSEGHLPHIEQIPLLGLNRHEESFDSPYDRRSEVYRHLAYEYAKEHAAQKQQPICTVPNLLTFLRLVLVPVVMGLWYSTHPMAPLLTAVLFVTASVTDWLDGFIARKVSQHTM